MDDDKMHRQHIYQCHLQGIFAQPRNVCCTTASDREKDGENTPGHVTSDCMIYC